MNSELHAEGVSVAPGIPAGEAVLANGGTADKPAPGKREIASEVEELEEEIERLTGRLAASEARDVGELGLPKGFRIKRVDGHGWTIDPPSGTRWVAFEETPAGELLQALATRASEGAAPEQKRDDTGRLTSDYQPTSHEIKVARDAICREFGNNGTDGYYVRILKAIHGAAPVAVGDAREGFETWFSDPARIVYVGDKASAYKGWQAALASQAEPSDATDTLVAVLNAIGYTEEFAQAHPDLKVSEGVKLFLASQAAPDSPAEVLKAPEGVDPMAEGQCGLADSIKRLTAAYCLQQALPIPDQMALVWRADIGRLRNDWIRLNAWQTMVLSERSQAISPTPDAAKGEST